MREENAPSKSIEEVLKEHTPALMAIEGVNGTAQAADKEGNPCIKVYVSKTTGKLKDEIPKRIEGWKVVIQETGGPFRTL